MSSGPRFILSSLKCELNLWALNFAGKTSVGAVGRAVGLYTNMHMEGHQGGSGEEIRWHQSFEGTRCGAGALGWWQDASLKTLGHTAGLLQLMV